MIELSFAISIMILALYIKFRKIEPTKGYYLGNEGGLVERAKKVTFFNALNTISTYVFPIMIALVSITGFSAKLELTFSIWIVLCLISVIFLISIVIAKIYSIIATNIAKKKGKLKRYIGGMWLDTSNQDNIKDQG